MAGPEFIPDKESLKIFSDYLSIVKDSPLALAALLFGIAAVLLYVISLRKEGVRLLNVCSFALLLLFGGSITFLLTTAPSAAKAIYYAGKDRDQFNVGKFIRISDTEWEDTSIITDSNYTAYSYKYKFISKRGSTLYFEAVGRSGRLGIDLEQREVIWYQDGNTKILYHVVVIL
jgi:hypothetical protein